MKSLLHVVGATLILCAAQAFAAGDSRLSDEPLPYLADEQLPKRTAPIVEIGDAFLGQGNIRPGFTLPTGAVWQPRLWVYGTIRSALRGADGLSSRAQPGRSKRKRPMPVHLTAP